MLIHITLITAALLGLLYVALSMHVSMVRNKTQTMLGDGPAPELLTAIRAHGNFAEFVPLALILMGGIELAGGSHTLLVILAIVLVAARIAHPLGMYRPSPNPLRAGGAIGTYVVILIASIEALILAI